MTEEKFNLLKTTLKDFKIEYTEVNGIKAIYTDKNEILRVCKHLKESSDLKFNLLVDAVCIDRFVKLERFEMIYNLVSIENNLRLFVRVKLDSKNPEMESMTQVWKSANWYEREAFDMMGINFLNHPDLRRMYMPEDYEYYPLRKDFPLMGIPDSLPLPNK